MNNGVYHHIPIKQPPAISFLFVWRQNFRTLRKFYNCDELLDTGARIVHSKVFFFALLSVFRPRAVFSSSALRKAGKNGEKKKRKFVFAVALKHHGPTAKKGTKSYENKFLCSQPKNHQSQYKIVNL